MFMSEIAAAGFERINWRQDDIAAAGVAVLTAASQARAELLHDVQPESLVIGGAAVRAAIEGNRVRCDDNKEAVASIGLERWAVDDDNLLAVRIAMGCRCPVIPGHARLLARQVTGRNARIPGVLQRRTDRIAGLAVSVAHISVAFFRIGEHDVGDGDLRAMRQESRYGDNKLRWLLRVYTADTVQPPKFDKEKLLSQIIMHTSALDDSAINKPFTEDDYRLYGQVAVDTQLTTMRRTAQAMRIAVGMLYEGRQVRPSVPQHDV